MVYFAVGFLTLLVVWIFLLQKDEMKKLDEKYTDTCPFNKDNPEEPKQEVEHKQKIKIE